MRASTSIVLCWLIVFLSCAPTYLIGFRYGIGVIAGATGLQLLHEVRMKGQRA